VPFHDLEKMEEKELIPGFRARFVHTDNLTLAYWRIDAGARLPDHAHPHEQVLSLIEGRMAFAVGEETREIGPGEAVSIGSGQPHGGRALTDCRVIDAFYPVREDYRKLG
jgi:quercetin dioxygenase-like cupin family protein